MPLCMNLLFALIMILVCVTVTELTRKYFLPNNTISPPHYPTANHNTLFEGCLSVHLHHEIK